MSIDKIKSLPDTFECNYYIYGKETGDSGTPHLQGYVELASRVTFNKLSKHLNGFHIESRKGTSQQAIQYCSKDGNVEMFGTPKSPGQRTDLVTLRDLLQETPSIKELLANEDLQLNYQSLRFAEHLLKYYDKPRDYKPTVVWLYGQSGTGKTRAATAALPHAYFKSNGSGKWWPGYDGEEDIILDDVESNAYGLKYLIGIMDRYPFTVEGKGGTRQFRGRNIYVTSLEHPTKEYPGSPDYHHQILRRIDELQELKP